MSETLENHEGQFQEKQFNPFLEKVAANIKVSDVVVLEELLDKLTDNKDYSLNQIEYEYYGGLCFMIGIDAMNQPYLNKRTSDIVLERLERHGIDATVIDFMQKIAAIIKPENVETIKQSLIESVGEQIKVTDTNGNINVKATINMIRLIKQVFTNSILPVSFAVDTNKVLQKKEKLTYDDMLKINTLITQHCAYFGKNVKKALITLNSNQTWATQIGIAVEKFDLQKYSYLYLDHIITFSEFNVKFTDKMVGKFLKGELTEKDFEKIVADFKESEAKKNDPGKALKEEVKKPIDEMEDLGQGMKLSNVNKLMEENPVEAIFVAFDEFFGKKVEDTEEFFEAVDKLATENSEYIQNLYVFMKTKIETLTPEMFERGKTIDLYRVCELLEIKLNDYRADYKEKAEFVCKPIDENIAYRLQTYVIACINDLVLETEDQKNYLISQLIEPELTTYNQVQQVVGLIETCKIGGGNIMSYVTLYDYLNYNEDMVEVFDVSSKLNEVEIMISLYTGFKGWFEKIKTVVDTKDSDGIVDEKLNETEKE